MKVEPKDTEISQLFSIYFGQDFDLFFDYDKSKSFTEQAISAYKKDCEDVPEDIQRCIQELKEIINHNYCEQQLENEVFPAYYTAGDPDDKLNHREFLEKLVEELER